MVVELSTVQEEEHQEHPVPAHQHQQLSAVHQAEEAQHHPEAVEPHYPVEGHNVPTAAEAEHTVPKRVVQLG